MMKKILNAVIVTAVTAVLAASQVGAAPLAKLNGLPFRGKIAGTIVEDWANAKEGYHVLDVYGDWAANFQLGKQLPFPVNRKYVAPMYNGQRLAVVIVCKDAILYVGGVDAYGRCWVQQNVTKVAKSGGGTTDGGTDPGTIIPGIVPPPTVVPVKPPVVNPPGGGGGGTDIKPGSDWPCDPNHPGQSNEKSPWCNGTKTPKPDKPHKKQH